MIWLVSWPMNTVQNLFNTVSHNYTFNYVGSYGQELYFIRGKMRRKIPNNDSLETFRHLGFHKQHIVNLTGNYFSHLIAGPPIAPIQLKNADDPDDTMRVVLEANRAVQGRLIRHKEFLGRSENPSVIQFQGRLLRIVGFAYNGEDIRFRWLDHYPNGTKIPEEEREFLGYSTEFRSTGIIGMDVRAIVIDETHFNIAFTNRFIQPRIRMGVAEFAVDPKTRNITVVRQFDQLFWTSRMVEKNWSPFIHNGGMYMIQSLNPFHVMGYVQAGVNAASAISSSLAPVGFCSYQYGVLRGGTNAIDMGDYYLAFFHTVSSPNPGTQTYFMGAYTFTKMSPWRLLGVSPVPILDKPFYTGEWAQLGRNRHIDYVVFPMSLYRDEAASETSEIGDLVVTIGVGDRDGWIIRFSSKEILHSLEPVVYCDHNHHPIALKRMYCEKMPLTEPPEHQHVNYPEDNRRQTRS